MVTPLVLRSFCKGSSSPGLVPLLLPSRPPWCLEFLLDDGLEVSILLGAFQLGEQVYTSVAFVSFVVHFETIELVN